MALIKKNSTNTGLPIVSWEYACVGGDVGDATKGKTLLLRADMDGLPMVEETDLEFAAKINGHLCGHDIHATGLLVTLIMLKADEDKLQGQIKVFIPTRRRNAQRR